MNAVAPLPEVDAATTLYRDCYAELVGYLDRLLGDRAAAEDVAQEAGMRLIETARSEPTSIRVPRAFLFHVATNLARDQLRRRVRTDRVLAELSDADLYSPPADTIAAARQEISQLGEVLAGLPARPREILILSRVEGLSHAEIGAQLGIATKTVENHVGRALAMLAQRLQPRGRG
jgi:RNA polymerase sigma factor (sigma-70 family)